MYKVFYNNRPVYLTSDIKTLPGKPGCRIIRFSCRKDLERELDYFGNSPKIPCLAIVHPEKEVLFEEFCRSFRLIEAGGGLVTNEAGEALMIRRKGVWDLPKGKLNRNESPEEGALREVAEECGIHHLSVEYPLPVTYHSFLSNHVPCLKKTYWFLMRAPGNEKLTPQLEEEITEVCWFAVPVPEHILKNTFASIVDVLKSAGMG